MNNLLHVIYSLGAAVVIIGILLKLQGYGDDMLIGGLITEAFVFCAMAFDLPTKGKGSKYKWTIKKEKHD